MHPLVRRRLVLVLMIALGLGWVAIIFHRPPSASRPVLAANATSALPPLPGVLAARPAVPQSSPAATRVEPAHGPALPAWADAKLLHTAQTEVSPHGTYRRVSLIKPADLPYRIRIEDVIHRAADGTETLHHRSEVVADHVLAQIDPGLDPAALAARLASHGATLSRPIGRRGLYRIALRQPEALDALPALLVALESEPGLLYAEPDYVVRVAATPDDPRYLDGSLWGLHNTGQSAGTPNADIDAPEGWAIRADASRIIVGVIDTGLALTHQDLAPNLWVNPAETADGTDSDGNGFIDDVHGINAILLNGNPADDQGHGSHCAGTIGASGNNGVGVTGVAWNVRLMGLKFLSASGGGATSDAITCIDYGVEHGAHILSNSWGGGGFSRALLDAIRAARDAGVIFVVAAGNTAADNDLSPVYPASLPVDNIVSVASTTRTDALSDFSCFGQGSVDIGAPGSDILSIDYASPTGYKSLDGTSMATPHVAGALALLRAQYPDDTWAQLINRLYRGGTATPALAQGKIGSGRRLNLHGALSTITNRPPHDDFASARGLYGDAMLLRTSNHGATAEPGQPAIHGTVAANAVWFSFTSVTSGLTSVRVPTTVAAGDPMSGGTTSVSYQGIPTLVEVFSGSSVDALTSHASGATETNFIAEAGVTYHFAIAGQGGAEGLIMLEVVGPPRNATLAAALPLRLGRPLSGTNRNALPEPGEPAHADQAATASIWYQWTANLTGRVAFTTRGSTFDTLAAVYSGPPTAPTFASLVPVGANDNTPGPGVTFSRVEFNAISGTTYYFAIDGRAGTTGTTAAFLAVPPPNDRFATPTILSGTDVTRSITTTHASREPGEPIPYPTAGAGESLWFNWTAPESGRTTLDLSRSFFPGLIAVYTGSTVDALTLVARDGAGDRFAQVTFDATQGTTYRILVDAWDWSLTNVPLRLRMVPIPANDTFADAVELQGQRTTIVGSNVGSTRELGEPKEGGSVWYKWTAPTTGTYGIYGERLNKPDPWYIVLNVYTGSTLNALAPVKEDLGNGIGRDAFVFWTATAGQTYHIQVTGITSGGIVGGTGPFRLDLRPRAEHTAPNDNFADATALDPSTPVYNLRSHSYGATAEPGEPAHAGYAATETLWWKFTAPDSGRYVFSTALSEGSRGTTVYRTTNPSAPAFHNLVEVANNVATAAQLFNEVAWEATAGTTYYIANERMEGARGRHIVHFQKVPANHAFAGRVALTGESATIAIQNHGAIRETGEPSLGASSNSLGHRSLWWTWTAPSSGVYQLDTIGSETPSSEDGPAYPDRTIYGFDTRLGVFTGSALGALTQIAVNDSRTVESYGNSWIDFQRNSRLEFTAIAGTTYTFLVNGENLDTFNQPNQTNTGLIRLNLAKLTRPANDDFAQAEIITGESHRTATTTVGASRENGERSHAGITSGRTLWWRWTAPAAGTYVVSTAGNLYDDFHARRTGVAVYTGAAVNALTLVAQDQNGAGPNTGDNTWSAARFDAIAGTTYHFAADAAFAGNLSFIFERTPPNDDFARATVMVGSRWTAQGHNLGATLEAADPRIEAWFNPPEPTPNLRSVWWRWTAPVSGPVSVDTLGSQNYNVIAVFTGATLDALNPVSEFPYEPGNPFNGDATTRARSGSARTTFNAVAGTTYHLCVQGAGYNIPSSGPITLSLVGPPAVPFAPASFTADRTDRATIELAWDDVAVDEEYYEIQRSFDGVSWTLLHQTPPDATTHADTTAVNPTAHHYRIRAVNTVEASVWVTAVVAAPGPPALAQAVSIEALTSGEVRLDWHLAPETHRHRVERATSAGGPWIVLADDLPATATYHLDLGLTAGTTYHYRVRAENDLGVSAWSTGVVTTPVVGALALDEAETLYGETEGHFTATITRSGIIGDQPVHLVAADARLSTPPSVVIPHGQAAASFEVAIADDAAINADEVAALHAFAPAAFAGDSLAGIAGSALTGRNSGWGWADAWSASPVGPFAGTPTTGSGFEAHRRFDRPLAQGSVWFSVVLRRQSGEAGTHLTVAGLAGGDDWVQVRTAAGPARWELAAGPGQVVPLLSPDLASDTLHLVMEIDLTARCARAWITPESSASTPTNALAHAEVALPARLTALGGLGLGGRSPLDEFGEIRVATRFADLQGGVAATRHVRLVDDEALSVPSVVGAVAPGPRPRSLTFVRARAEHTYDVLASRDLVEWTVVATNPGRVGEPVTVVDDSEAPRFLRLRITR